MQTKYKVGDVLTHKIGTKMCVTSVKTEIRDANNMLVQLENPIYLMTYAKTDGHLVEIMCPEEVLD